MNEEPIRQATRDEILLLLRDRQHELRLLFDEPLAIFSMPVERYPRILVTLPDPPVQDDAPVFMTIDERTVCVPIQLAVAHEPLQCGPWPLTIRKSLGADLELAIAIRRRQMLAESSD